MNKEKRKNPIDDLLLNEIEINLSEKLPETLSDYTRSEFQLLLSDLILLALPSPSQHLH